MTRERGEMCVLDVSPCCAHGHYCGLKQHGEYALLYLQTPGERREGLGWEEVQKQLLACLFIDTTERRVLEHPHRKQFSSSVFYPMDIQKKERERERNSACVIYLCM